MQGEDGKCVFEHLIKLVGVADGVICEVQIVICINSGELPANHQAIAMADKDGFDVCKVFRGSHKWKEIRIARE